MAYTQLLHMTQQTYAAVKGAFREHFEPESKRELYKVQFESHKKQAKENWADFGDDLMVLVNKAFPNLQEAQEQLAVNIWINCEIPKSPSKCILVNLAKQLLPPLNWSLTFQGQTEYLSQKSRP